MARGQGGQATVEFALCLPLVALLVGVLLEVGALAADQLRLWHAAREAARVAVVDPNEAAARAAARRSGLAPLDIELEPAPEARRPGLPLTARLAYRPRPVVPLVGSLFAGVTLEAEATMRIEQP